MVNHEYLSTQILWRAQNWYHNGVTMAVVSRRKLVFKDTSILGWGVLHEGSPTKNCQGGTRSGNLYAMARDLLL